MSYRKQTIPKTLKNTVWNKYIGQKYGIGDCYCCKNPIDSKNFECGHVKAESKGGKMTLQNLRPICGPCNRSMGNQHMFTFMRRCGFRINANILFEFIYFAFCKLLSYFIAIITILLCFDIYNGFIYTPIYWNYTVNSVTYYWNQLSGNNNTYLYSYVKFVKYFKLFKIY